MKDKENLFFWICSIVGGIIGLIVGIGFCIHLEPIFTCNFLSKYGILLVCCLFITFVGWLTGVVIGDLLGA